MDEDTTTELAHFFLKTRFSIIEVCMTRKLAEMYKQHLFVLFLFLFSPVNKPPNCWEL